MNDVYKLYQEANSHRVNTDYLTSHITANQEDFGSFVVKISDFFFKKMSSLAAMFGITGKNNTKELDKISGKYSSELRAYDKDIEKISNKPGDVYLAVSKVLIPYMPGIKPDYYTLITSLKDKVIFVHTTVIPLLADVDDYISKIVGNEDFRISAASDKELVKSVQESSNILDKYLQEIMDGRNMNDHRELGDVIPNFSSLKTCHDTLKDIIGARDLNNLTRFFDLSNSIANNITNFVKKDNKTFAVNKTKFKEVMDVLGGSAQLVNDSAAILRILDTCLRIHRVLVLKLSGLK